MSDVQIETFEHFNCRQQKLQNYWISYILLQKTIQKNTY